MGLTPTSPAWLPPDPTSGIIYISRSFFAPPVFIHALPSDCNAFSFQPFPFLAHLMNLY